jgi:hemerythrin-like domain-containing protein
MLAEHGAGRAEVRGLLTIGNGSGPLTNSEKASVAGHASEFVPLLYGHIQKENNILYPMAQNSIAPEEFERLDRACEAFDSEVGGSLDVASLKALAGHLVSRYPAQPANLAVYAGCGACH